MRPLAINSHKDEVAAEDNSCIPAIINRTPLQMANDMFEELRSKESEAA